MRCTKCGNKVKLDATFCTHCGERMASTDPATNEKESQKTRFPLKRFLIIGTFVVLCLVYFFGFRCKAGICPLPRSAGGEYCFSHTCEWSKCKNKKAAERNYCYTHSPSYSSHIAYTPESAEDVLEFSDINISHNSSYTVCTGTLTNNGRRRYSFVEVKGKFQNSSGKVLDTDWTYAVGSEGLAPGESTTFRISVDKNYDIRKCTMEIIDYDRE